MTEIGRRILSYWLVALTGIVLVMVALPLNAASSSDILMYVGESRVIKLPSPVAKIAIGNGKVVSAASVDRGSLLVIANDAGVSTVYLWLKNNIEISYSITVTASNVTKVAEQVKMLFRADPNIRIQTVGQKIFLEADEITNLQAKKIEALEKTYPNEFVAVLGGNHNLQERTIYLSAKIIEIKKSALDDLGVQWSTSQIDGPSIGVLGDIARNNLYNVRPDSGPLSGIASNVKPFQSYLGIASIISSKINLLEQRGDAYVVASPQLASRCGGNAKFNSGGELPIATTTGLGQVNIEYKPYGIRLEVEPNCDTRGNVRAKVLTEVSQIDRSTTVAGVPGLLTRKTESEMDLESGKPMVMSGLTSLRASEDRDQVPLLGRVPVLGWLFSNRTLNGERSELVVLITPAIISADDEQVTQTVRRGERMEQRINKELGRQDVVPFGEEAKSDWHKVPGG